MIANLVENNFSGQRTQYIGDLILKICAFGCIYGRGSYSFDEAFPHECFIVLATENNGEPSVQVHMRNWNTSGFEAYCTDNYGGAFHCLAIGY